MNTKVEVDQTESVDSVFDKLVEDFTQNHDKPKLIQIMYDFCVKDTTTPQQIYELKKKLELEFSKKVDCQYCFAFSTPVNYGCDLREIFYDRENNLTPGDLTNKLLDIFNRKKLPDIWHIMTDIDDTLYPNTEHGTYIAGADVSWRQKQPYPGIIQFYQTFYEKLPEHARYSTILSATPGCLKPSKLEDKPETLHKILGRTYGFIQGPEGKMQIASHTGDIIGNFFDHNIHPTHETDSAKLNPLFTLFGNTKFERFKQYARIFPEYKILFLGDNGQGDVLAGRQMLEHDPRCFVFIHAISKDGKTYTTAVSDDKLKRRMSFFRNYSEVAYKLKILRLFNVADVQAIKDAIENDVQTEPSFQSLYLPYIHTKQHEVLGGGKTRKRRTIKRRRNGRKTR
jgi:hypothetical protein